MSAEEDSRERDRNEHFRVRVERRREQRFQKLSREAQIRKIAREESRVAFYLILGIGAAYIIGEDMGIFWGLIVFIGIWLVLWLKGREEKKRPDYMVEEIDDLAEEAVTHERVGQFDAANIEWLKRRGPYAEPEAIFEAPFWELVDKRVSEFERKSHKERLMETNKIKMRSLPILQAKVAELRAQRDNVEFPYWITKNS